MAAVNLHDAILFAENYQMLHFKEPQGRVTANAIREIQIKCKNNDIPDEWREKIAAAIAAGYPDDGFTGRPGTWRT